ncbi:unnamed protein product [Durusdinium trenchii]|uniref:Fe2OG dioxygenase domain-containing protein n=1 Tax=Durusdinium trenchii TaxID=1381693 RepID=A0ABP0I7Y9_9DINO
MAMHGQELDQARDWAQEAGKPRARCTRCTRLEGPWGLGQSLRLACRADLRRDEERVPPGASRYLMVSREKPWRDKQQVCKLEDLATLGPCCAGLWTIMDPKGERLYCAALPPAVAPLPACLRRPARVAFDGAAYDLRAAAVEVLEKAQLGSWKSDRLEEYTAPGEIFRCFRVRQALHRCVEESTGFLEVYERLVQKVLVPWLKQQAELSERTRFSYQFPPTLRLQPGNSEEFKRPHRDAEYGHQDYSLTRSTLWVESEPGKGDYQPLEMSYGEIAVFHGTLCRHHVPANSSPFCRISMDFRIGVGEFFDPHWTLKGVKHIHQRREIWL